jgi:predicted AlkP superfamily phosphohydrolase/phosphomutase
VIGLDGADPNLVWPWAKEGKLPNIARLMAQGAYGPLHSTYPPISAAAWATFMTGQQPGHHGVFDFRNYNPRKYSFQDEAIVSSAPIAGYTVMDAVAAHGHRVGAVTIPITYPAWAINGAMVSGYPTPDASKSFTYPPELGQEMSGLTENSALFRASSPAQVLEELNRLTRERARVSAEMLRQDDHGLFVLVIGSTDRAHHDFWKYQDPDHPAYDQREAATFGDAIIQVYQEADRAIGTLLDAVDEDTTVIIMSDHGGGPRPAKQFNVNAWLRSQGLLTADHRAKPVRAAVRSAVRAARAHFPYQEQLYRRLPASLKRAANKANSDAMTNAGDIVWPQTQAYRFPMHAPIDGIVLNVRGRQQEGSVGPGAEYEALRDRIIAALGEASDPDTRQPVVISAVRREDLYEGEYVENMPDVVITLHPDYEGGPGLETSVISAIPLPELSKLSGVHRMNGIVIVARGEGVRHGAEIEGAHIVDLAPTIMYVMGLPVPRRMDGKVLLDAFDPTHRQTHAVEFSNWSGEGTSEWSGYSEEEEQDLLEQLRRLGYVE